MFTVAHCLEPPHHTACELGDCREDGGLRTGVEMMEHRTESSMRCAQKKNLKGCKGVIRTSEQTGTLLSGILMKFLVGFVCPQHPACSQLVKSWPASCPPSQGREAAVSWLWGLWRGFVLWFGEGIKAEEGRPRLLGMKEVIENTLGKENT